MNGKSNIRQRAISDYNFIKKKTAQLLVHLQEGKLTVNVARIGTMYVYSKLSLGKQEFLSENSEVGGLHPRWDQFFSFNFSCERYLMIFAYDRSLIFGETEIGRCSIDLTEVLQGKNNNWWKLLATNGQIVGEILIGFEFSQTTPNHTPNSSWDLKLQISESPISAGRHLKQMTLVTTRTPDLKITHCSTEPDEINDLETLREDFIKESARIKNQENNFRVFLEKLDEQKAVIINEKRELNMHKEVLQRKEESILKQKIEMEAERERIEKELEEIKEFKEHLNREFLELKKEQLLIKAKKAYQGKLQKKITKNSNRILFQSESLNNKLKNMHI